MNVSSLAGLSAMEAGRWLRDRRVSSEDLVQACLDEIRRWEPITRAWVHLDPARALQQARAIDQQIAAGEPLGPLAGIPLGVKDIFNTADMPTQMGSPIWEGFTPGNDARVVHYLRMAGGIVMGKTVTAEFAVHAPGPTRNPYNPEYMPGTSSSGSAVAVACGMVPVALGTQTAGSIIRPASYCGVYGFKPSFGLLPRTGMLKTTDWLDTVGYFSRSPEDLPVLLDILRVKGLDYPLSNAALSDPARQSKSDRPWRIGFVRGPRWECAEEYAVRALEEFARSLAGVKDVIVEEVPLPQSLFRAHEVHSTIYDRSLAYYFKEEFKKHTLVSKVMYDIINHGNEISLDSYKEAVAEQSVISSDLDSVFASGYDALLTISTGGEALYGLDSVDRPDSCLVWTLCGAPVVNLPLFKGPNGLPFGAQLLARRYNDHLLLNLVNWLHQQNIVPTAPFPALQPQPGWESA